jgi:hypothetical protein
VTKVVEEIPDSLQGIDNNMDRAMKPGFQRLYHFKVMRPDSVLTSLTIDALAESMRSSTQV